MEQVSLDDVFAGRGGWDEPARGAGVQPEPVPLRHGAESSKRSRGWLWLAPLMLALGCLWQGLPGSVREGASAAVEPRAVQAATVAAREPSGPKLRTRRIDEMRIGQRVLGNNPLASDTQRTLPEPIVANSRLVRLRMTKDDGGELRVELLRSVAWILGEGAAIGESIWLDMPEFGASGWADVVGVEPCPTLDIGKGRLVTGRFVHSSSGNLRRLWTDAEREPTGVTGNHRYWSVTRGDFVEVDQLRVGEELDTANGRTRVRRIETDPRDQVVYNLEVHGEHVYRVGDAGVLVHNFYPYPEGTFSLLPHVWRTYPQGLPRPSGPFRLLLGDEYRQAREAANAANRALHRSTPSLAGKQIHEIHPVKFGGSPTDSANKIPRPPSPEHSAVTNWWNALRRSFEE
jgi:hypothetical protein